MPAAVAALIPLAESSKITQYPLGTPSFFWANRKMAGIRFPGASFDTIDHCIEIGGKSGFGQNDADYFDRRGGGQGHSYLSLQCVKQFLDTRHWMNFRQGTEIADNCLFGDPDQFVKWSMQLVFLPDLAPHHRIGTSR